MEPKGTNDELQESVSSVTPTRRPEVENARREALARLGKYAIYTAPFTLVLLSAEADVHHPRPHHRLGSG